MVTKLYNWSIWSLGFNSQSWQKLLTSKHCCRLVQPFSYSVSWATVAGDPTLWSLLGLSCGKHGNWSGRVSFLHQGWAGGCLGVAFLSWFHSLSWSHSLSISAMGRVGCSNTQPWEVKAPLKEQTDRLFVKALVTFRLMTSILWKEMSQVLFY